MGLLLQQPQAGPLSQGYPSGSLPLVLSREPLRENSAQVSQVLGKAGMEKVGTWAAARLATLQAGHHQPASSCTLLSEVAGFNTVGCPKRLLCKNL